MQMHGALRMLCRQSSILNGVRRIHCTVRRERKNQKNEEKGHERQNTFFRLLDVTQESPLATADRNNGQLRGTNEWWEGGAQDWTGMFSDSSETPGRDA